MAVAGFTIITATLLVAFTHKDSVPRPFYWLVDLIQRVGRSVLELILQAFSYFYLLAQDMSTSVASSVKEDKNEYDRFVDAQLSEWGSSRQIQTITAQ